MGFVRPQVVGEMMWVGCEYEVTLVAGPDRADGAGAFGPRESSADRFGDPLDKGGGDFGYGVVAGDDDFAIAGGGLGGGGGSGGVASLLVDDNLEAAFSG